jgi:hypothetical protein
MTHDAVTHDVVLARGDGSKRKFRVFGRPMPGYGDTITLPIDGQLIRARNRELRQAGDGPIGGCRAGRAR